MVCTFMYMGVSNTPVHVGACAGVHLSPPPSASGLELFCLWFFLLSPTPPRICLKNACASKLIVEVTICKSSCLCRKFTWFMGGWGGNLVALSAEWDVKGSHFHRELFHLIKWRPIQGRLNHNLDGQSRRGNSPIHRGGGGRVTQNNRKWIKPNPRPVQTCDMVLPIREYLLRSFSFALSEDTWESLEKGWGSFSVSPKETWNNSHGTMN